MEMKDEGEELRAQAVKMDRMYRFQRHFYDLTRKYFLFGRDRLLAEMDVRPGDKVLELGCVTGRNLAILHRRHPKNMLLGLDVSQMMLKTAKSRLRRPITEGRVILRQGWAERMGDPAALGAWAPFEVVFFSYSLSMMPVRTAALTAGLAYLRPGRTLYVLDFWDQADLPSWFRKGLRAWLARFDVHFQPELLEWLRRREKEGRGGIFYQARPGPLRLPRPVHALKPWPSRWDEENRELTRINTNG